MMRCNLVCFSCKREHLYSIKDDFCPFCGEKILDAKIKPLVFALNICGVRTERSCEGHDSFDDGFHPFPWVTVYYEEDLPKLEKMIDLYNYHGFFRWKVEYHIYSRKYWLFPKDNYKRLETLHKEALNLADFILNNFGQLKAV